MGWESQSTFIDYCLDFVMIGSWLVGLVVTTSAGTQKDDNPYILYISRCMIYDVLLGFRLNSLCQPILTAQDGSTNVGIDLPRMRRHPSRSNGNGKIYLILYPCGVFECFRGQRPVRRAPRAWGEPPRCGHPPPRRRQSFAFEQREERCSGLPSFLP